MLHFTALPDELAAVETGLFVPAQVQDWPAGDGPRRMGVSSFGMSGTNVHAVLEQAPALEGVTSTGTGPLLFPLSATSADALRETAGRLADWVSGDC